MWLNALATAILQQVPVSPSICSDKRQDIKKISGAAEPSKKPKMYHFHAEWEEDFFFTMSYSKCICLICQAIVTRVNLLNLVILKVPCELKKFVHTCFNIILLESISYLFIAMQMTHN